MARSVIQGKNTIISDNPFPGFRPFYTSESSLFFGRKKQTGEVLKKLLEHNSFSTREFSRY